MTNADTQVLVYSMLTVWSQCSTLKLNLHIQKKKSGLLVFIFCRCTHSDKCAAMTHFARDATLAG